jgi:hypothetical protein
MQDNNKSNTKQDIQKEELDAQSNNHGDNRWNDLIAECDSALKSFYEEVGGEYIMVDGYRIPTLESGEKPADIGMWGRYRERFLKEHQHIFWAVLKAHGKLNAYLAAFDVQMRAMFIRYVNTMAEKAGVTEELKAADQMKWARQMNNIRNAVKEMILSEYVYI